MGKWGVKHASLLILVLSSGSWALVASIVPSRRWSWLCWWWRSWRRRRRIRIWNFRTFGVRMLVRAWIRKWWSSSRGKTRRAHENLRWRESECIAIVKWPCSKEQSLRSRSIHSAAVVAVVVDDSRKTVEWKRGVCQVEEDPHSFEFHVVGLWCATC